MLLDILENLRVTASNDDFDSRRTHERRSSDQCIAMVDGQSFTVENWSQGGILLNGDTKRFSTNDLKDVTIKFKTEDKIINIEHKGTILRKNNLQTAIQFLPLTERVDKQFQHVIDDYVTKEFAKSQR
ncbi:MAG: PilZ domain-containing protein [Pseudomonadota bacterium]